MPKTCCVWGCNTRCTKECKELGLGFFFRFPTVKSKSTQQNIWIQRLRQVDNASTDPALVRLPGGLVASNGTKLWTGWQPTTHDRICGRHFKTFIKRFCWVAVG